MPSATLTWAHSGLGTKTGTSVAAFISDLAALVNATSPGAAFSWELASSSIAGNPHWVALKPKGGGVGRILIIIWTSTPAGINSRILDTAPSIGASNPNIYIAYFPMGNVDTPSNLNAASGTIMGNDTGAVKVTTFPGNAINTVYQSGYQLFYFDSAEAVVFGVQPPNSFALYVLGAGNLIVDNNDDVYPATFGSSAGASFGSTNSGLFSWTGTIQNAGAASSSGLRTNYGSANRVYFPAFTPSGIWANQPVGPGCILTDTATSRVWFVPVPLLGQTKGEGMVLKLRQIGYGPGTVGSFTIYQTSGPVVQARQFCATSSGGNGFPWFTNFKL